MKENTKMMVVALSLLPAQDQTAICMSVLNAIALSNKDNPVVTDHGLTINDDPIDNIISFLTAMKSACGPVEQVGKISV